MTPPMMPFAKRSTTLITPGTRLTQPTACGCVSAGYRRGVAVSSVSQASPKAIASRSRIVRFSAFSRAISSCALASRAWSDATVARSAAGQRASLTGSVGAPPVDLLEQVGLVVDVAASNAGQRRHPGHGDRPSAAVEPCDRRGHRVATAGCCAGAAITSSPARRCRATPLAYAPRPPPGRPLLPSSN
jgi:hypothetical protein